MNEAFATNVAIIVIVFGISGLNALGYGAFLANGAFAVREWEGEGDADFGLLGIGLLCLLGSLLMWFGFTGWRPTLLEETFFQNAMLVGLSCVLLIEGVAGVACLMVGIVSLFKDRFLRFGAGLAGGVATVVLMAAQFLAVLAALA